MKILGFTGSRAEYYILRPLFISLSKKKNIEFELIISGGITKEKDKKTIKDIKKDKVFINQILDIPNRYKTHSEKIGFLCIKLTPIIQYFQPDLSIVYADRFESFAFAISCTHSDSVLLHIEAGDITQGGTYDDYIRHCISKMSHLFCTSTAKGKNIIDRLGEEEWRSIHSGLLSYDDMSKISLDDQNIVRNELKIFNKKIPIILATMHPSPRDPVKTKLETQVFFNALKKYSILNESRIFITSPNNDEGREYIISYIQEIIKSMPNTSFHESLGGYRYQTIMSLSREQPVIICGNSSSIIKEAPYYGANSLNIGSRQSGRETANTIVNCEAEENLILISLKNLNKLNSIDIENPYYKKNVTDTILNFIFFIFKKYSKEKILNKKWNFDYR